MVIHSLGGLLIGVAQPFVMFRMLLVCLGCAFGEPQITIFQVGRQVVRFQNLKADLFQGLLVGLEVVRSVEEEPVVDEFLGGRADIGLGLDQVVEDHDAAWFQDPVGLAQRGLLVRNVIDNRLAPEMRESSVLEGKFRG